MFQSPLLMVGLRSPFYPVASPSSQSIPRPDSLLARMIPLLLESNGISDLSDLGSLHVATSTPEAEFGQNLARHVAVLSELPQVHAVTMEQGCNGLFAAMQAAALRIQTGLEDLALVAAVDMPDRVPAQGYNPAPSPRLMQRVPRYFSPVSLIAEELCREAGVSRDEETGYLKALRARVNAEKLENNPCVVRPWDEEPNHESEPLVQNEIARQASPCGGAVLILLAAPSWEDRLIGPRCRLNGVRTLSFSPQERAPQALQAVSRFLKNHKLEPEAQDVWELFDPHVGFPAAFQKTLSIPSERINRFGGALMQGDAGTATAGRMMLDLMLGLQSNQAREGMAVVYSGRGMVGLAHCSKG